MVCLFFLLFLTLLKFPLSSTRLLNLVSCTHSSSQEIAPNSSRNELYFWLMGSWDKYLAKPRKTFFPVILIPPFEPTSFPSEHMWLCFRSSLFPQLLSMVPLLARRSDDTKT